MKKIPYPKYPRELNLSSKLSDKDIKQINALFREGKDKSFLSRKFKVSRGTIRYWLATPKERKAIARKRSRRYPASKYYTPEQIKEMNRMRSARKRKLMGKKLDTYYNQPKISWIKKNPNKKEIKKGYWKRYVSDPKNQEKNRKRSLTHYHKTKKLKGKKKSK